MRIVSPEFQIILPFPDWDTARKTFYQMIEKAGRTCYKSENKITEDSAKKFVRQIVKAGHEAMLEHVGLTVRFIVDRGVSHEIVRHRLASFAQESTRYCNYGKGDVTFVRPFYFKEGSPEYKLWLNSMEVAEEAYLALLESGRTPQEARCVLPNSLKTEVVMTANMREWRHFLKLRAVGTTGAPHPQMQEVAMPLLKELQIRLPELFDDIGRGVK